MRATGTHSARSASHRVGSALSAACLLAACLLGCERKAPGPVECSQFAESFVGVARNDERASLAAQSAIDEVTQLCLTVPYDRTLIACAQATGRARACFDAYKQRTRSTTTTPPRMPPGAL